ncbi:MAG: CTP synthase [Candidatus Blackburnbacteria bacterium]|nr:CTP synthase [Candidatus Blackburnbacteria bacterium]
MAKESPKYIFVSGGVLSGIGKGITTASIALLLKSRGIKVTAIKCDMYLNIDAGTMNPVEHGEVFVTDDGVETDQDLGHYERFLNENLSGKNYITAGQIYYDILRRERQLEYQGKSLDAYEIIPEEIIKRINQSARGSEVVVVELGGTVGEYQNVMFFEAIRRLKIRRPESTLLVHLGYLPIPKTLGEIKSKPLQQSIHELNSLGLRPDFVVARSERSIDQKRKEKIAFSAALDTQDIIANPDVETIYEVPIILDNQSLTTKLIKRLKLGGKDHDLVGWRKMVERAKRAKKTIVIGLVAKYIGSGDYMLEDSYICVNEAIKHAAWSKGMRPEFRWIDAEDLERANGKPISKFFEEIDAIVVPQGWGSRGTEGKIKAIKYARENKIPYLGLCFGMQMASIEFARNVLKLRGANSEEVNPKTPHPVIHIMPNQKEYLAKKQYGGTIRLGVWDCRINPGTILSKAYGKRKVLERHRHRYEFNNKYKKIFEKAGVKFSGVSPDNKLVEAIELNTKIHPFFVGVQFHPEYKSRPLNPHPIFLSFIEAATARRRKLSYLSGKSYKEEVKTPEAISVASK